MTETCAVEDRNVAGVVAEMSRSGDRAIQALLATIPELPAQPVN